MLKSVLAEHLDEQLVTYIRDQSCIIHQIDTLRHFDKYESADEMLAIWGNMTTVLKVRAHQTQHQLPTHDLFNLCVPAIVQGLEHLDGGVPRGRRLHIPQQIPASPRKSARAFSGRMPALPSCI